MIVFTRCGIGLGTASIQSTIIDMNTTNAAQADQMSNGGTSLSDASKKFVPNRHVNKLNFVCIGTTSDPYFQCAIEQYQNLLDASGQNGQVFVIHNESDAIKSIRNTTNAEAITIGPPTSEQWRNEHMSNAIETMCDTNYKPFKAMLDCGDYHQLKAPVLIWPSPAVS